MNYQIVIYIKINELTVLFKHLLLTTIAAVLVVGCGPSVDIWTMTIFQTFALCVLLIFFLSSGCYCLWNGAYLLFNYLKPDFLSNPRFAYIHHRKGKLPIPAIALIRMFLGLPLLWGCWFFLAPSKWNCPECGFLVQMGNSCTYCYTKKPSESNIQS